MRKALRAIYHFDKMVARSIRCTGKWLKKAFGVHSPSKAFEEMEKEHERIERRINEERGYR